MLQGGAKLMRDPILPAQNCRVANHHGAHRTSTNPSHFWTLAELVNAI
jgi:hypothetical protein